LGMAVPMAAVAAMTADTTAPHPSPASGTTDPTHALERDRNGRDGSITNHNPGDGKAWPRQPSKAATRAHSALKS
jgi:hypothetical protein